MISYTVQASSNVSYYIFFKYYYIAISSKSIEPQTIIEDNAILNSQILNNKENSSIYDKNL
jgi:hypothetical protein